MIAQPHPGFRYALRLGATAVTVVAAVFLLSRATVPEGRLSTTTDFSGPAPFLSEPKPSERITDPVVGVDGKTRRPLTGTPLYLDLKPPAEFDSVTVTLRYANVGAPVVELAALASSPDGQYDVRGAEHRLLDSFGWESVTSGSLALYQRRQVYASVDGFLRQPPPASKLATYRAEPPVAHRLEDYEPSETVRAIRASLRGGHRILTYVKGEPLSFSFSVQDMNRELGADPAFVNVFRLGDTTPLASARLDDDGSAADDQKASGLRTVAISLADPAEGAYRVEFTATPDVFIREIRTRQSKVAFEGRLFLGDYVGYSDQIPTASVWTDGSRLAARTPHAEGTQTLVVGAARLTLDQPNVAGFADLDGAGLVRIDSPKRNVLLETDGTFAFSESAWFDPLPFRLDAHATREDLDRRGIDFVFASYAPPEREGETLETVATFDLSSLARTETGAYRFAISAPGADAEEGIGLLLESATFALRRDSLWSWGGLFGGSVEEETGFHILPYGVPYGEKVL